MKCSGGIHEWEREEDAARCCAGSQRALVVQPKSSWPPAGPMKDEPLTVPTPYKLVWLPPEGDEA